MRLAVFGAGAVGCHIAARLARAGIDPVLVGRPPTVAAIRTGGLRLVSDAEDFTVPVSAEDDTCRLGTQDAVIVALKAHTLGAALDDLVPLVGPDTVVTFAVNGIPWWYGESLAMPVAALARLDPGGRLKRKIGAARTVGCVVHSANAIIAPGVVRNVSSRNRFLLGAAAGSPHPRQAELAAILAAGLDEVGITDNIRAAVWEKLLHNLAASSIGCLTLSRADQIASNPGLAVLYRQVLAEARAIAAALGITLPDDASERLAHMAGLPHRSSMQQDLIAGRPLELDAQILVVRDLARALSCPAPVLEILSILLEARTRSSQGSST
ncbi:ketopantoate reductase family protein [Inquilinus limosus]|uniref:2-dehydropantoate 2-reductase n=1 Tax=Inquilinus limosus TaxID=171674 RepID=A0A211ZVD6_9PROT|nr:2-dehydropantoate 2-reductase [Inquilinus limosus]OWJ69174.1 hypothetical protein BWR60_01185 [Inquilinus limosus]